MKRFLSLTILGILCLTAHAAKIGFTVTPGNLEAHGFSMKMENKTDGTVEITLIRDLAKARQFTPQSGLQISRYATLRVSDKSGLRAQCSLAPNTRQQGVVSYRFTISRDCIAQSSFELAENDDYQDQTREHLIGGGTHYSFALGSFAKGQAP